MKKLVKPVYEETIAVLAYDNENCYNCNGCGASSSSGNSTAITVAIIGAAATIGAACIGYLCT